MAVNFNPAASGNKTASGIIGAVLVTLVVQLLKQIGIDEANGTLIAVQIVGYATTGIWTLVGIIHKGLKAKAAKK